MPWFDNNFTLIKITLLLPRLVLKNEIEKLVEMIRCFKLCILFFIFISIKICPSPARAAALFASPARLPPGCFFSEFESIKNRLEQRNERPPISHWIMSRAPFVARRNANHGRASWLLLGVKNGPRGALRSLSCPPALSFSLPFSPRFLPSRILSAPLWNATFVSFLLFVHLLVFSLFLHRFWRVF